MQFDELVSRVNEVLGANPNSHGQVMVHVGALNAAMAELRKRGFDLVVEWNKELPPVQEWPRWAYHTADRARDLVVASEEEFKALGEEFGLDAPAAKPPHAE